MRLPLFYLISENIFCRNSLDWSDFLKSLDVEVLLIAEDEVAPRLASHILVFKLHDVFESQCRQLLVNLATQVVVDATLLGCEIRVDDVVLGDTL